jgi:hypothetical protein
MAEEIAVIWVKREGQNFFGEDWTGKISLKLKENFFSTRIPARAGYGGVRMTNSGIAFPGCCAARRTCGVVRC